MPVFTEYSTLSRDLRNLPSFAPPLPRLSSKFEPTGLEEKYEVVIAGVGVQFLTQLQFLIKNKGWTCWPLSRAPPRAIWFD
jgi:hypothetical protein